MCESHLGDSHLYGLVDLYFSHLLNVNNIIPIMKIPTISTSMENKLNDVLSEYAVPLDEQNILSLQMLAQHALQSATQRIPIFFVILTLPPNAAPHVDF
jgi:hypothetical protein